jgi:hypothetical protein
VPGSAGFRFHRERSRRVASPIAWIQQRRRRRPTPNAALVLSPNSERPRTARACRPNLCIRDPTRPGRSLCFATGPCAEGGLGCGGLRTAAIVDRES